MSQWTHPQCEVCWDKQRGSRTPTRLVDREVERCCWCGQETRSGIYVREDANSLPLHQEHREE